MTEQSLSINFFIPKEGVEQLLPDTGNSTFLQNLLEGKKLFIQVFNQRNFNDYVRGLSEFLVDRNINVLSVSIVNLTVTTSHGVIYFCTNTNRERFLKGRNDFVEVFFWTVDPKAPPFSSNQRR